MCLKVAPVTQHLHKTLKVQTAVWKSTDFSLPFASSTNDIQLFGIQSIDRPAPRNEYVTYIFYMPPQQGVTMKVGFKDNVVSTRPNPQIQLSWFCAALFFVNFFIMAIGVKLKKMMNITVAQKILPYWKSVVTSRLKVNMVIYKTWFKELLGL